jgi:hypothetical protein
MKRTPRSDSLVFEKTEGCVGIEDDAERRGRHSDAERWERV